VGQSFDPSSTKSAVAISNKLGLDGHTRTFSESVASKPDVRTNAFTISNELVEEALENDCTHIVFEQLNGIRERLPHAKAVHKWAFHRLYEYVTYKAESEGLVVRQINPAYTSQRCSKCGFTHEDNRPHNNGQDEFGCLKCGYDVHADYNAAKNIGLKYLRDQQSLDVEVHP